MKKQKVVLVDDDETCQFINAKVIELSGLDCEIHTACSGLEALDVIGRFRTSTDALCPDVIFVDLNMPVMDGFQFIQAFQKLKCSNEQRTMIVVLTSSDSVKDKQTASALGVRHFIMKPLTQEHVTSLLASE